METQAELRRLTPQRLTLLDWRAKSALQAHRTEVETWARKTETRSEDNIGEEEPGGA